jgi:tetratricopeptide (TPR) repeat protein
LAHAASLGDARLKVVGLYRIGAAHIHQGDVERGLRCCDKALSLNPLPYDVAMAKVFRGYGQIRAGRFDAGIADLAEAIAWFDQSRLHHVRVTPALRLAEGYLLRGDLGTARALIDDVLSASRAKGYRYVEGLAHRLLADCLAQESPAVAAEHVDAAQRIFSSTDARNDLAKALVTRAGLYRNRGDFAAARELLEEAAAIFGRLGTLDEPIRVRSALAALEVRSPSQ